MGCTSVKMDPPSEPVPEPSPVTKAVDPRLPVTNYRELYRMKNSWKAVSRALEDTAKLNLMRFFRNNPDFQALFDIFQSKNLTDEETIFSDLVFETHALAVFHTFDDVFANVENVDVAIKSLHRAGMMHRRVPNFKPAYFVHMEESFIQAIRDTLGDRYNETTEKNMRLMFHFTLKHLQEGYELGEQVEENCVNEKVIEAES